MDVNDFNSPCQLTKSIHWDLYPALDPTNPDLSASGKVVIIACAESAIENVSASQMFSTQSKPVAATLLRWSYNSALCRFLPLSPLSSFHIRRLISL